MPPPSDRSQSKATSQTMLNFNNNQKEYVHCQEKLDIAVADLIVSKGLPFSLSEDVKFKQLLALAKHAPVNYTPPSRYKVSGLYLEQIHAQYVETSIAQLSIKAMFFGLSVMGDGATIKKSPLLNFLVSGAYYPIYVAKILDTSDDLK